MEKRKEKTEMNGKKKRFLKRLASGGVFLLAVMQLLACSPTEIEDREFPVILEIKNEETFTKDWLNSLQEGNKKIDYNHLKVIMISQEFLENEAAMAEMLMVLKQDKKVPLNAYVITAENPEELTKAGEALDEPLGNYLEALLENSDEIKKETYPTIGMLYQEKENRMETLFIPCFSLVEEKPEITAYEAYKRGRAVGSIETDAALFSFFLANQMEEFVLQIGVNNYLRLTNPKNELIFEEHRKPSGLLQKQVQVQLCCDAEIILEKISGEGEEVRNWLERQLVEYLETKTADALARGIDLTNSKKKLGAMMRSWYDTYEAAPDAYEEEIEIVFETKITWS